MLFRIFTILFLVISVSCFGQNKKVPKYDTSYIKAYKLFTIKFIGSVRINQFEIKDNLSKKTIQYSPNESLNLGFGINTKSIGVNVFFNLPHINNDNHIYGQTQEFDLTSYIYGRKFYADFNYGRFQGFYLKNYEIIDPEYLTNYKAYPQRSDIKTYIYGGSLFYSINNRKFSYRAPFIQTEWQKKSAGTILVGGYMKSFELDSDSSIVPLQLKNTADPEANLIHLNSFNTGTGVGYAYTVVIRKLFFITISAIGGIGYQALEGKKENKDYYSKSGFVPKMHFKAATGINSPKFFAGIFVNSDHTNLNLSQFSRINYQYGNFRFYIGRRFGTEKIKQTIDRRKERRG
ncbi:MAG: DUF4421 family protein [Cytophagaceae bacterium]